MPAFSNIVTRDKNQGYSLVDCKFSSWIREIFAHKKKKKKKKKFQLRARNN